LEFGVGAGPGGLAPVRAVRLGRTVSATRTPSPASPRPVRWPPRQPPSRRHAF